MRKSDKVRQVYAELKAIYGEDMSSREILECASLLVDATEETLYEPANNLRMGRVPFSELPSKDDGVWKLRQL